MYKLECGGQGVVFRELFLCEVYLVNRREIGKMRRRFRFRENIEYI